MMKHIKKAINNWLKRLGEQNQASFDGGKPSCCSGKNVNKAK